MLYGANLNNGKYRFLIDQEHGKIRLFKRVGDELIPLVVWTLDRLVNEMLSTEE